MPKYKVSKAFQLDGVPQEVGAIVELSEEEAAEFCNEVDLADENDVKE